MTLYEEMMQSIEREAVSDEAREYSLAIAEAIREISGGEGLGVAMAEGMARVSAVLMREMLGLAEGYSDVDIHTANFIRDRSLELLGKMLEQDQQDAATATRH